MSEINSIETYIVRYLYGEITEDELRELDRWLEESSENMKEFTRLKILHDFIRNRHTAMGEGDIDRSWRKMKRKMTGRTLPATVLDRPERKKIWPGRLLKYVAAATVTAMIGFGAGDHFGRRSRPAEEIRPAVYSEVHVPRGGKPNTVILSDGSVVRLNAATTLRYPSDFDGDLREIYLDGEAFFEVAKNEVKPFVVRLKQQNVVVHGTSFNVEAYHSESYTVVTLQKGSVSVESMNNSGLKINDVMLMPGQEAHFDQTAGKVSVTQVDASLSNMWMDGTYKFKDEPLVLIFKKLENYYDVNIHVDGKQLKDIRCTGTFSFRQNIGDVLRIINHEQLYCFRQDGNNIYITNQ